MADKVQIGGRMEALTQDGIIAETSQIESTDGRPLSVHIRDMEGATSKNSRDINNIKNELKDLGVFVDGGNARSVYGGMPVLNCGTSKEE